MRDYLYDFEDHEKFYEDDSDYFGVSNGVRISFDRKYLLNRHAVHFRASYVNLVVAENI